MKLLRRIVTPARAKGGFIGLFAASLLTGIAANVALLFNLSRQSPYATAALAPAATSPLPREGIPRAAPTKAPRIITTSLAQRPRSLGAAASPRRYQYENHIAITQAGKTIPLPVHTGTVDVILGPLQLQIAPGASLVWNPTSGLGVTTEVHWVSATSSVNAEDATHRVTLTGAGFGAHSYALDPTVYLPEDLGLPFTISNTTSHTARVTIRVGLNSQTTPGGDD